MLSSASVYYSQSSLLHNRTFRAKGLVPLPGVRTMAHADEVVGCLGWWLQQPDVDILDREHAVSKLGENAAIPDFLFS